MTTKTRRTTIMIERHEVTLTRQNEHRIVVYCQRCKAEVSGQAATEIVLQLTAPPVESRSVETTNQVHFVETTEGKLPLICGGRPDLETSIEEL